MSAVGSSTSDREGDALRRAQRAHEPSMEEILASIRNIIADDRENAKSSGKLAVKATPAPGPAGPQIVYSKDPVDPTEPRADAERADKPDEAQLAETAQPRVVWSQPPAREPAVAEARAEEKAAAPATTEPEAVAKPALRGELPAEELAVKKAVSEPPAAKTAPISASAPLFAPETDQAVGVAFGDLSATLARRAEEIADAQILGLLRPMLKDWLNQNMPGIVEKLVRAEIERITRAPR